MQFKTVTISDNLCIYRVDPQLTVDVERVRLLALADGVADLALDDGAVLAPVEAVDPQQGPVVPGHDRVRQEPPEESNF